MTAWLPYARAALFALVLLLAYLAYHLDDPRSRNRHYPLLLFIAGALGVIWAKLHG